MRRLLISATALLAVWPAGALADDVCGGDEARRQATSEMRAALAKAERSGKAAELFMAYQAASRAECVAADLQTQANRHMPKLARDLAKQAEASGGVLYSKDPIRAEGRVSAFAWLEAGREFAEADRVMLKAVHAKPDDLELFKAAWNIDDLSGQRSTGQTQHYAAPQSHRRELEKVARARSDRLMALEEKDAQGLSGDINTLGLSAGRSLETLRQAAGWMKFLPGGDKPTKVRAEQRGDFIMKRGDAGLTGGLAIGYYDFAGSPKADLVKQEREKFQRSAERSVGNIKEAIVEKGEADQKKFQKGKADLEKELGF